jgi:hypothetical protein
MFQKMGEGRRIGEVIDRDQFQFHVVEGGAKEHAASPAKTVDRYLDCHLR